MDKYKTIGPNMRALIVGASGGIGSALTMALGNECGMSGVVTASRSADGLDITDEDSIAAFAQDLEGEFDLILVATGALELNGVGPEKTIKSLSPDVLQAQFAVNAIGPALILKHLHAFLPKNRRSFFGVLTARVGSIADNRAGGWVSYRAAKAAANQIVKTASIELLHKRPEAIVAALHPGTVRTDLTADYAGSHPTVSPEKAAENLLTVIDGLTRTDTGGFFDWQGKRVEW